MSIIDGIKSNAKTAKWVGLLLVIAGIVSMLFLAAYFVVSGIVEAIYAFQRSSRTATTRASTRS